MPDDPSSSSPLTFDVAGSATPVTCTLCSAALGDAYFTVNGQVVCTACQANVATAIDTKVGPWDVAKGVVLGSVAGAIGALVWWAIRRFASLEIGLIAIGIGHFVGIGVRSGSRDRGGRGFQVLAVALTYFWITANYLPDVLQALMSPPPATSDAASGTTSMPSSPATAGADAAGSQSPAAGPSPTAAQLAAGVAFTLGIAMAAPFLGGFENIIGLAIIAFGLYQAWKLNAKQQIAIEGPFRLDPAVSPEARV